MRIIATESRQATIYNKGTIQKESMSKLVTKEHRFIYNNKYNYELYDNSLYLTYINSNIKAKVSSNNITSIVYSYNDNVYYLVDDTLYKYNLKYGETKIVQYSEWSINYKNLIFINN